jgi:hypothetical protein
MLSAYFRFLPKADPAQRHVPMRCECETGLERTVTGFANAHHQRPICKIPVSSDYSEPKRQTEASALALV